MLTTCLHNKGCIVEWNNGEYSLFNGQCSLLQIFKTRPNLLGLTVFSVTGIKFSRKRKPTHVYYVPQVTSQEVLHNNFVGVKNDNFEGFSEPEQTTEGHDCEVNGGNVGM